MLADEHFDKEAASCHQPKFNEVVHKSSMAHHELTSLQLSGLEKQLQK
jgi:hypothetical protein